MRWAGHVALMGERRSACRVLVGKAVGKSSLEVPDVDRRIILRRMFRHSGSPRPKYSEYKNPLEKFSPPFFVIQTASSIDYLPNVQTVKAEYYSSLLVQLKDFRRKYVAGSSPRRVLFLHDSAPAHQAFATQKKLAYLGFQCLDHPPYSPALAPSECQQFSGLKNIERSSFFVRRGGHCCHGHLVGGQLSELF